MPSYYIEWSIELDADSPREAADLALAIQRNPEIREFWAGGDCPAELWARIVKATTP